MELANTLTALDYSIFGSIVAISLGIGLYFSIRGQKTTSEFIVASRQMKVFPLAVSLMVSFESSIMMLGMPAEVYTHGFSFVLSMAGFSISQMIASFVFAPFFHRLHITSVFEYLELRYKCKAVRNLGTVLGILSYLCYLGIVLYGPSIALEAVTHFPMWCSIVTVALSSAIYTSMGGMKAVVWTDVFQSLIMYSGMVAVFIKGSILLGGFGRVWQIAKQNDRLYFNPSFNPYTRHTIINLLASSVLRGFGLIFNQSSIQRISSTKTESDARKILWITSPLFCGTTLFSMLLGLLAFAFFETIGCDPLATESITNSNQVMPFFVLKIFQDIPGVTGLFIASVMSASLSTLSSGLSSLSTMTLVDFVKPYFINLPDKTATIIAKVAVFAYGVIAIGLAFLVTYIGGSLTQIAGILITVFSAPLTGLFLYTTLFPWGKTRGTMAGSLISTFLTLWMAAGRSFSPTRLKTPYLPPASIKNCILANSTFFYNETETEFITITEPIFSSTSQPEIHGLDKWYSLSYTLIGVFGILAVPILGTIIDFASYDSSEVDYRYVIPVYRNICSCLPKSWQKSSDLEAPEEKHKDYPMMDVKVVKEGNDGYKYVMPDTPPQVSDTTMTQSRDNTQIQHGSQHKMEEI